MEYNPEDNDVVRLLKKLHGYQWCLSPGNAGIAPTRVPARLVEYHARNPKSPGLGDVIDALVAATWKSTRQAGLSTYLAEVQRVADRTALTGLLGLAANDPASPQARTVVFFKIDGLKKWIAQQAGASLIEDAQLAHCRLALREIERFEKEPAAFKPAPAPALPPGAPIGAIQGIR